MADDIHLTTTTFEESVSKVNSAMQTLEAAIAQADSAVADAIESVGGSATPVGAKMDEMCQQANTSEFEASKNSLQNFIGGLGTLGNDVQEIQTDILAKLNAIENGSN